MGDRRNHVRSGRGARHLLGTMVLLLSACGQQPVEVESGGSVAGYPVFSETQAYRNHIANEQLVMEAIEECMTAEGFEYRPEPIAELDPVVHRDLLDEGLSDEAFAQRYGFGLSTTQDLRFAGADADLAAIERRQNEELGALYDDMSPEERQAYFRVLNGTENEDGEVTDEGCQGRARREVGADLRPYLAVRADIERAKIQFLDDARVTDHYLDWAACMDRAGYDYGSPLAAYLELNGQLAEVMRQQSEVELAELRRIEVEVAAQVVDCGESSRDLLAPELDDIWSQYIEGAL